MFTGIIQATATVASLEGGRLVVDLPPDAWPDDPIQAGESVAVNGCCLTALEDGGLAFDLSPETLERTSLACLASNSSGKQPRVNLERAMTPNSRFGGHIVQGHVDATGELVSATPQGNSVVLRFRGPSSRYLVDKGSVAIDGVSLTVVTPENGEFDVWTIPFTLAQTTLGDLRPGDCVNLEWDEVAKWVERLTAPYS